MKISGVIAGLGGHGLGEQVRGFLVFAILQRLHPFGGEISGEEKQ